MHIELRCKVKVKDKYNKQMVEFADSEFNWRNKDTKLIRELSVDIDEYKCDSLSMPFNWLNSSINFNNQYKDGVWVYSLSVKSEDDINYFFDKVLNKIVEKVVSIEVLGSCWEYSKSYNMVGKRICLEKNSYNKYR